MSESESFALQTGHQQGLSVSTVLRMSEHFLPFVIVAFYFIWNLHLGHFSHKPTMGKIYAIALRGDIGERICFDIGAVIGISEGVWNIALSSVSFSHTETHGTDILSVRCNQVTQKSLNEKGELARENTILNMIAVARTAGVKNIIGFKQRDYFEINNAQHELFFELRDELEGKQLRGSLVIVHALLRRIR